MKRTILTYGGYFERFIATLELKEKRKVDYLLSLLESTERLPVKFIKHIRDGLYELRIGVEGNIYRVFFIFDEGNVVILFNGFKKKSQKTPKDEIKKALRIKAEYYADKRSQN